MFGNKNIIHSICDKIGNKISERGKNNNRSNRVL